MISRAFVACGLLAAPAGAQESAPTEYAASVKYDKGFTMASGDGRFEARLGLRTQARLEVARPDAEDEYRSRFLIPRLRFQIEGFAYGRDNSYKVEFDMANKGQAALKDFYLEHAFYPALRLRVGQWKRPYSRHEIVSDFGSEFLERSIANDFGGGGRDIGAALHNGYDKSPDGLEWALGVFNGTGDKPTQSVTSCADPTDPTTCVLGAPTTAPADFGPMVVARAGWNTGGIKGYSEGDLEGGPARLAVGASYKVNFNDFQNGKRADGAEVDAMLKAYGASLHGALYVVKNGAADRLYGFYVQPGYFVVARRLQLAARFSQIDDDKNPDEKEHEILGAIDVYFDGHAFKWMTDGGVLHGTDSGQTDLQFRTQLQLVF